MLTKLILGLFNVLNYRTMNFPGPRVRPRCFHCPRYSEARLIAAKKSRIPLHTKAFLYRDIAHEALAEVIRDTRLGTRMKRATKEEEREEIREAEVGDGENGDEVEENGNEEEWEEDEELVGAEAAPVLPEEALAACSRMVVI
ncbi:hypothetical protein FPQ18DRAFT_308766 [Pyronema domesticum]|nr:hypothetical protein FPQ18DRAFT_308766 [Pyronema domesticum]